jgi:8-hydroxy-5-deazaflavin:NADPH oxidoreductase
MSRLAVLGTGHVGPVIARLALAAGWSVTIANSGDPAQLELITELLIPGAAPRWADDAVRDADIVVLAMPLHRFLRLESWPLSGRLVIDAMNYWPSSDGVLQELERDGAGSSEVVAERLDDATVVKTLNHIGYHDLEEHARPAHSPERRALGVAGDDAAAVDSVAAVVDRLGYDPVVVGGLAEGRVLQPGGPVFGVVLSRADFERAIRVISTGVHPASGGGARHERSA